MKRIALISHTDMKKIYWFEPLSGGFYAQKFTKNEDPSDIKFVGWGEKIRDLKGRDYFAALYFYQGKLNFQIDSSRWNLLNGRARFKLNKKLFSTINQFSLFYDGEIKFECDYWSYYVKIMFFIDAIFSDVNEEDRDFLVYLTNNYNDEKNIIRVRDFITENLERSKNSNIRRLNEILDPLKR